MKTEEELKELKKEFEELNSKLKELSEDELNEVSGGVMWLQKNERGSFTIQDT